MLPCIYICAFVFDFIVDCMCILHNKKKVKLDLSNYVTKADLKKATGADTSEFLIPHSMAKNAVIFGADIRVHQAIFIIREKIS